MTLYLKMECPFQLKKSFFIYLRSVKIEVDRIDWKKLLMNC